MTSKKSVQESKNLLQSQKKLNMNRTGGLPFLHKESTISKYTTLQNVSLTENIELKTK
jgi:hypothetical protein